MVARNRMVSVSVWDYIAPFSLSLIFAGAILLPLRLLLSIASLVAVNRNIPGEARTRKIHLAFSLVNFLVMWAGFFLVDWQFCFPD